MLSMPGLSCVTGPSGRSLSLAMAVPEGVWGRVSSQGEAEKQAGTVSFWHLGIMAGGLFLPS